MARRRRRGEGSVYYDRSERTWIARISVDGKRYRRRATSELAAKQILEDLRRRYAQGPVAAMRLGDYLDEWLEGVRSSVRPSTFTSYSGHVRMHIKPVIGTIGVATLEPRHVRRLIADREAAGLKPNTVRRIVTTLQMALGQAVRDGSLRYNVANGLRLPRATPYPIEAMTFDDADRIVDAVRDDRLAALYTLLLYSGMRLGEAVALDWGDVDLEAGTIHVRSGKTRAARRTVPLAAIALDAMRVHRKAAKRIGPKEPVFIGERKGDRLRGDVVTHDFPRLLESKGLPRMRVHDLRHGTATLLLALKVPARDIADLLGHASPSITMNVYMHVTEAMKREAVGSLDRRSRQGPAGDRVPEKVPNVAD